MTTYTTALPSSTVATKRSGQFLREAGILVGLFVVWQYLVWLKGRHVPTGAISRGRILYTLDQWLPLPSQSWLQTISRPLWSFANVYYDFAHVFVMLAFLLWVVAFHRDKWRYYRRTLFVATFAGLLVQSLWASAPPRMIGRHILDTANLSGLSIYSTLGRHVDQYSAFPSLHVAWAAIIGVCGWHMTRSFMRWIWVAHPALTVYVVVVTGNHYWLDCVAGLALAIGASAMVRSLHGRNASHHSGEISNR